MSAIVAANSGDATQECGVMVCPEERIVAADLAGAIAKAGVDPTREGRALHDALLGAIADRRGSCPWDVDHAGWVVTLMVPEEQTFSGRTLSEGLAWCLVWLMFPELGIGQFLI